MAADYPTPGDRRRRSEAANRAEWKYVWAPRERRRQQRLEIQTLMTELDRPPVLPPSGPQPWPYPPDFSPSKKIEAHRP